MNLTFEELKSELKQLPEIDLMEILEISAEDLVERFEDKIELKYEKLIEEFRDDYDSL